MVRSKVSITRNGKVAISYCKTFTTMGVFFQFTKNRPHVSALRTYRRQFYKQMVNSFLFQLFLLFGNLCGYFQRIFTSLSLFRGFEDMKKLQSLDLPQNTLPCQLNGPMPTAFFGESQLPHHPKNWVSLLCLTVSVPHHLLYEGVSGVADRHPNIELENESLPVLPITMSYFLALCLISNAGII